MAIPTSGIKAWVRASDSSAADGDVVTTIPQRQSLGNWTKSPSGIGTVNYRSTGGPNSAPAYEATAAGVWSTTANSMSGVTSGEYFAVVKANSNNSDNRGFHGRNAPDHNYYPYTDSKIYEKFGRSTTRISFTPTMSVNTFRLYNVQSTSGAFTALLNAVQQFTDGNTSMGFEVDPYLFGSGGWTGHLVELIVYDRVLSSSERNDVYAEFNSLYAFTLPVPAFPATVAAVTTVGSPVFNATVTPTTVAATTTVGSASALTISPATVAAAVVMGAVTVTAATAATATPSTVAAVTTVGSATAFTPDALATPSTVSAVTTVGTAAPNVAAQISATTVAAVTTVGTPTTPVVAYPSTVAAVSSVASPTIRLNVAGTAILGGVTAAFDVIDDRDRAAFIATITYPENGDAVVSGGITVYATGSAVDNSGVNIQVQVSEFPDFIGSSGVEELVDTETSEQVGPSEVAVLSLTGLEVDTTYYIRARAGHNQTNEWGDWGAAVSIVATDTVGEGYLWLYASDVDNSLPHPHLWSAHLEGSAVVMIGAGFGDPQAEYTGEARATYYAGQVAMTVQSWDRVAATGDADTEDRAIEYAGDADPEHDVVYAALPPNADSSGVGVYIQIGESDEDAVTGGSVAALTEDWT